MRALRVTCSQVAVPAIQQVPPPAQRTPPLDFASHQALRPMPEWVREIIRKVASDHRITPAQIICNSRSRRLCPARRKAMYLVKAEKPEFVTAPMVGRWFRRNHTTVLAAWARYSEETGAKPFTKKSAAHRREWARKWHAARKGVA